MKVPRRNESLKLLARRGSYSTSTIPYGHHVAKHPAGHFDRGSHSRSSCSTDDCARTVVGLNGPQSERKPGWFRQRDSSMVAEGAEVQPNG